MLPSVCAVSIPPILPYTLAHAQKIKNKTYKKKPLTYGPTHGFCWHALLAMFDCRAEATLPAE